MAEKTTFVKLDRNITGWRWYQNANTFRVFIHCLISASIKDYDFEGVEIKRGSFPTSYEKLANSLDLSIQQVRTALGHLKSTGEITTEKHPKYQVVTLVNYDLYQWCQQADEQAINRQPTFTEEKEEKKQKKNKEEVKNYNLLKPKKEKNIFYKRAHAREEEKKIGFDLEEFFNAACLRGCESASDEK